MTSIDQALAANAGLSDFEGKRVDQVGIEIPGAAGGLRDAVKIEPQEFAHGDTVYVAMECTVVKVRHEPIDKDDPSGAQRRVHVFGVDGATIVGEDVVRSHIDNQRERIRRAREEASGILRLHTGDELEREHNEGKHSLGLVDGCPDCDAEAEAMEEESQPE